MTCGVVLGVYREQVLSPGMIGADAAVLEATLAELSGMGREVVARRAESLDGACPRPAMVLTMAQSQRALGILEEWGRHGTRVINSVSAVRNCYRRPLVELLRSSGVCMPRSRIVSLEGAQAQIDVRPFERLWLKRGDVHAMQSGDVASVASREDLARALNHFHREDIPEILVQEHVEGPVVKFYGVGRHDYFRAYQSATGEEVTARVPKLVTAATLAAKTVGLDVYGGDAVLTNGGGVALIDLNDWPSFSPCCRSAAKSIAGYVTREIHH